MSQAGAVALPANPALSAVYVVRPDSARTPVPRLVHRMLELFDGTRSLAEVCSRLQIPEAQGLATVRKLSSLGLVEARPAPGKDQPSPSAFERIETHRDLPARHRSGFSAAEEAFFASEVLPAEDEPARSLADRASLFVSDLVLRLRGTTL